MKVKNIATGEVFDKITLIGFDETTWQPNEVEFYDHGGICRYLTEGEFQLLPGQDTSTPQKPEKDLA